MNKVLVVIALLIVITYSKDSLRGPTTNSTTPNQPTTSNPQNTQNAQNMSGPNTQNTQNVAPSAPSTTNTNNTKSSSPNNSQITPNTTGTSATANVTKTNTSAPATNTSTTAAKNTTSSSPATNTTSSTKTNTTASTNTSTASTTSSTNTTSNSTQPWFAAQLLDLHNVLKMSINYANYTWSDSLYATSQAWADYLASSLNFYHSGTAYVGENLATATIRDTDMIAYMFSLWSAEKKYFIPWERFPNCSTTGNWGDVAHYTQLVWGASTQLGCGLGVNANNNVLVCQYSEAGNYIGNYVYLNKTSIS